MYYRIERRNNLLQISENYASLVKEHSDGSLTFEFRYNVSQSAVILKKAVTVDVSIITRTMKKRSIVPADQVGNINPKVVINNILSDFSAAKSVQKSAGNFVIASQKSDISSKINNDAIGDLQRGISPKNVQQLYKSNLKQVSAGSLREANEVKPLLSVQDLKVDDVDEKMLMSSQENTKKLSHDLILRRGIDPSIISTITPKLTHAEDSFKGTLRKSTSSEQDTGTLMRLHDHVILNNTIPNTTFSSSDISDQKLISVVVNEAVDNIDMVVLVTFLPPKQDKKTKNTSDVFVKFQLLDPNTGSSIDTVTKQLDISRHVNLFRTPTISPVVKQARSDNASRANIEIRQVSESANEVRVYKKNLYTSDIHIDDYKLIGVYPCTYSKPAFVQVDLPINSAAIYRVIPSSSGILGNCFSSIVLKPKKYTPVRALALTSKIVDAGILVEARKLPPDVISIQILQRNLTIHEKEFTPVGTPILIDDVARSSDHLSYVFEKANHGYIYEFAVKLYHSDGVQVVTATEIIEYIAATPGKVVVNILDVSVSHDKIPNVIFSVDVAQTENNLDIIKAILETQGNKSYFETDIEKQRSQLKSLLAYSVQRIDLSTGDRENMGTLTTSNFSDIDVGKISGVQNLKYGHAYRYVVTAVARNTETTFDSFVKITKDPFTKKTYQFSPAKFLHPMALSRGVLNTPAGIKSLYSKSTMDHGVLGSSAELEIKFDASGIQIIEAVVSRFDYYHNVITWKYQGDASSVDHFIIMKEINGSKVVLGTAHNSFTHGTASWLHLLSQRDNGEIKYVITPVLSDFNHGSSKYTNSFLVENL